MLDSEKIKDYFYAHFNAEAQGIKVDWLKVAAAMCDMLPEDVPAEAPEVVEIDPVEQK